MTNHDLVDPTLLAPVYMLAALDTFPSVLPPRGTTMTKTMTAWLVLALAVSAAGGADASNPRKMAARPLQACTLLSAVYTPSQIETEWIGNISRWQQDYCAAVKHYVPQFTKLLSIVKAYDGGALQLENTLDDVLVSRFVYTYQCGNNFVRRTGLIEPLVGALRYPLCLCTVQPQGMSDFESIVTREYLMMARSSTYRHLRPQPKRSRQQKAFLFDLGRLHTKFTWDYLQLLPVQPT